MHCVCLLCVHEFSLMSMGCTSKNTTNVIIFVHTSLCSAIKYQKKNLGEIIATISLVFMVWFTIRSSTVNGLNKSHRVILMNPIHDKDAINDNLAFIVHYFLHLPEIQPSACLIKQLLLINMNLVSSLFSSLQNYG